jgi:hypothetical protein
VPSWRGYAAARTRGPHEARRRDQRPDNRLSRIIAVAEEALESADNAMQ